MGKQWDNNGIFSFPIFIWEYDGNMIGIMGVFFLGSLINVG